MNGAAIMQGLFHCIQRIQCIQYKVCLWRAGNTPTHDLIREGIDDKSNADEPLPGRDVSKVADPQHVWRRRSELPVYLVFWAWLALIRDGCVLHLPANNAMDSKAFHQPGHSAAGDLEFLSLSLMPDLSDAVDLIVFIPDTLDFKAQIHIPFGAIRRQVRVSGDRYMRIKCGLGDWQNLANRLDTQVFAMLFYEGNHRLKGGRALPAQNMLTLF